MIPLSAFLHSGGVLETPLEGIFFAPIDTTVPPRDVAKPWKPQPAKELFREQRRADLAAIHPSMAIEAMNRLINEEWVRLNEAAKAPFKAQAQADVERYKAAIQRYEPSLEYLTALAAYEKAKALEEARSAEGNRAVQDASVTAVAARAAKEAEPARVAKPTPEVVRQTETSVTTCAATSDAGADGTVADCVDAAGGAFSADGPEGASEGPSSSGAALPPVPSSPFGEQPGSPDDCFGRRPGRRPRSSLSRSRSSSVDCSGRRSPTRRRGRDRDRDRFSSAAERLDRRGPSRSPSHNPSRSPSRSPRRSRGRARSRSPPSSYERRSERIRRPPEDRRRDKSDESPARRGARSRSSSLRRSRSRRRCPQRSRSRSRSRSRDRAPRRRSRSPARSPNDRARGSWRSRSRSRSRSRRSSSPADPPLWRLRQYVATPAITCAIGLLQATPSKKMLLSALCASLYQQGFKSEIAAARGPKRFFLSCPLLVCELDDCKKGGELVMLPEAAAANAAAAAAAAASGFKSASTFAAGGAPPEASARFAASPPVSASAAGSAAPALPPVPSPPGTVPETALARAPPWIYDPTTRRLVFREGLCGAIFGATNTTLDECLQRRLFGLPHTRRALVAAISKQHETPSLPQPVLFLFNFQKRELHGVFAASGSAGFPLHADAWVKGSWSTELGGPVAKPPRATSGHTTQFPAQIPVDRLHVFAPLAESVFRHVMKYHSQNKFDLSLSAEQVEQLVCLFIEQAKSHGHGDSRTLRSAHPKASSAP